MIFAIVLALVVGVAPDGLPTQRVAARPDFSGVWEIDLSRVPPNRSRLFNTRQRVTIEQEMSAIRVTRETERGPDVTVYWLGAGRPPTSGVRVLRSRWDGNVLVSDPANTGDAPERRSLDGEAMVVDRGTTGTTYWKRIGATRPPRPNFNGTWTISDLPGLNGPSPAKSIRILLTASTIAISESTGPAVTYQLDAQARAMGNDAVSAGWVDDRLFIRSVGAATQTLTTIEPAGADAITLTTTTGPTSPGRVLPVTTTATYRRVR